MEHILVHPLIAYAAAVLVTGIWKRVKRASLFDVLVAPAPLLVLVCGGLLSMVLCITTPFTSDAFVAKEAAAAYAGQAILTFLLAWLLSLFRMLSR